jgi:hypothetical protein
VELRVQLVEQLTRIIAEQTALLWDSVQGFLDTGSDARELADALGISVPTLYRRLADRRAVRVEHSQE